MLSFSDWSLFVASWQIKDHTMCFTTVRLSSAWILTLQSSVSIFASFHYKSWWGSKGDKIHKLPALLPASTRQLQGNVLSENESMKNHFSLYWQLASCWEKRRVSCWFLENKSENEGSSTHLGRDNMLGWRVAEDHSQKFIFQHQNCSIYKIASVM